MREQSSENKTKEIKGLFIDYDNFRIYLTDIFSFKNLFKLAETNLSCLLVQAIIIPYVV